MFLPQWQPDTQKQTSLILLLGFSLSLSLSLFLSLSISLSLLSSLSSLLYLYSHAQLQAGGFGGTYFLNPLDPLFQQIGSTFISIQGQTYGNENHLYNADPFNELDPPSSDPAFLETVSQSIFSAMHKGDSKAVWVLQGWFLISDQDFWRPAQTKAFLGGVADSNMIVLDLWAEVEPAWNLTNHFYGKPFVWNMLHNFGGRSGLYGTVQRVNEGPFIARKATKNMIGIGMTPEAIETNPVVYALLTESAWNTAPVDLGRWASDYVRARYPMNKGGNLTSVMEAWRGLTNTVYTCYTNQMGTSGNILSARPNFDMRQIGCCATLALYYDPMKLVSIMRDLQVFYGAIGDSETLEYDLVDLLVQTVGNDALSLYSMIVKAYSNGDVSALALTTEYFLQFFQIDALVAKLPKYRLSTWVNDARSWGADKAESDWLEINAKTQVTLWGDKRSTLTQYAYKMWSGLIADFYQPRWALWFKALQQSLDDGVPINMTQFTNNVETFEYNWTQKVSDAPVATGTESPEQPQAQAASPTDATSLLDLSIQYLEWRAQMLAHLQKAIHTNNKSSL
eukprot:TRINITY_DN4922_c0_g1_i1.p1 TRINITY_DN4922_c0_g1~~TRINITY_DN4922_c0_g1_i1.p1  ORF type:complete len:565 (-),score=77.89 TRINITY_DN4922_c0_g1_i1:106-1800(-)